MPIQHLQRFATWVPRFLAILTTAIAILAFSSAARANCTALPILSELVNEVDKLQHLTSPTRVIDSGKKIAKLRGTIQKFTMFQRLQAVGYGRKLEEIMRFKIKLGVLSNLAMNADPARTRSFQSGSDFQRGYLITRDLVQELCQQGAADVAALQGNKEFKILSGNWLASITGLPAPVMSFGLIGLTICALVALGITAKIRTKKRTRQAAREKRFACEIPATLHAQGAQSAQTVVDISLSGVNIRNPLQLPIGTPVSVTLGSATHLGVITWSNQKYSGAQLTEPLTQAELAQKLTLSAPAETAKIEKRGPLSGTAQLS